MSPFKASLQIALGLLVFGPSLFAGDRFLKEVPSDLQSVEAVLSLPCLGEVTPPASACMENRKPKFRLLSRRVLTDQELGKTALKKPTHIFDLDAIVIDGSGWTESEVMLRIKDAVKIFDQCQVSLGQVTVTTITGAYDVGLRHHLRKTLRIGRNGKRPVLVYARKTMGGLGDVSFSIWEGKFEGVAFISRSVTDEGYQRVLQEESTKYHEPKVPITYQADAHELSHLFGLRHASEAGPDHIMNTRAMSARIKPEQCEVLKKSPYVRSVI